MHLSIIIHFARLYIMYYVSTYPAVLYLARQPFKFAWPMFVVCPLPIRWIDLLGYWIRTLTFLGRNSCEITKWSCHFCFDLESSSLFSSTPGQWLVPQVLVDRSSPSSECFLSFKFWVLSSLATSETETSTIFGVVGCLLELEMPCKAVFAWKQPLESHWRHESK